MFCLELLFYKSSRNVHGIVARLSPYALKNRRLRYGLAVMLDFTRGQGFRFLAEAKNRFES